MATKDEKSKQTHAMNEEADVSGGTGGRMGGDLNDDKSKRNEKPAGQGAAGQPAAGAGSEHHQSDAD